MALTWLAFGIGCGGSGQPSSPQPQARNIVLILADDLGYADVSANVDGRIATPNIDRIGAEGVVFGAGYVTASVCTPSRAALLTGRYQQRYGLEFATGDALATERYERGLAVGERTLGDLLRLAGLRTAMIGKWHLGNDDEFYPTARGFDEFFGFLGGQTAYVDPGVPGFVNVEAGSVAVRPRSFYGEAGAILEGPNRATVDDTDTYLTEELTRKAVDFIQRSRDERFFLYLAYSAPHLPFQAPQRYYDRLPASMPQNERVYAAMIAALDDGVGSVLDTLERLGIADETLVLFLSDNGCATPTEACSCTPLRGGKLSYFEGGVRVPFLMRWRAGLAGGRTFTDPVSTLDVVPTVLRAVGGRLPSDRAFDGVDLLPYLRGEKSEPHRTIFWRAGPMVAVRDASLKLWRSRDGDFAYLFDLERDPGEVANLAPTEPGTLRELDDKVARWEHDLEPPAAVRRQLGTTVCGGSLILPF